MEPIRPDDDELRAGPGQPGRAGKKTATEPASPASETTGAESGRGGKPPGRPDNPAGTTRGSGGGRGVVWLALVFAVVVVAGAAGWLQQQQRIEALEGQLEEADYWARQSKLALARFEGELSETGENLQQTGASIEQQLVDQKKRLDTADSEIRKLWAVANERNRRQLEAHQGRLDSLEGDLAGQGKAVESLTSTMKSVQSSLGQGLASLEKQVASLRQANRETESKVTELAASMDGVDQIVERRLQRFEQEQRLGMDGLESRVSAVEKATSNSASGNQLQQTRAQLAELRQTVSSIDASRAQLTSRLIRLSEEVDQLRSDMSK